MQSEYFVIYQKGLKPSDLGKRELLHLPITKLKIRKRLNFTSAYLKRSTNTCFDENENFEVKIYDKQHINNITNTNKIVL